MNITIKDLAAEIGVSKQAIYKRATGKLKNVIAPYMHTEYNRMFFTEEGAEIIRKDFRDTPYVTTPPLRSAPMPGLEYVNNPSNIQNTPERSRTAFVNPPPERSGYDPEYSGNDLTQVPYKTNNGLTDDISPSINTAPDTPERSASDTDHIRSAPMQKMEYVRDNFRSNPEHSVYDISTNTKTYTAESNSDAYNNHDIPPITPECSGNVPDNIRSTPEHIQPVHRSDPDMQTEIDKLRKELEEQKNINHQKELELVRTTSEKEKLEQIIEQLNERIDDKNDQIEEQRQMIQRTDAERKILTASLFRNNEFIEKLMRLPLSKRVFGWKEVQKSLTASQNDVADNVAGEGTVNISPDDNEDA